MPLETYRDKRRFNKTPEPPPLFNKSDHPPIFVIQEHHASRLHYDFRLEADGVLKSWAVPKGPSMNPSDKRLAVEVEDHPLEYANFSGDIPEGEYGAGHVDIWDRGTYDNLMAAKPEPLSLTQSIDAGHVEVELHGQKLKGGFVLIRTRGFGGNKKNWLLIKMKDRHADHDPKPATPIANPPPQRVRFTNADKILFPESRISKGDLIKYYMDISGRMLPYLKDRPITLERFPDGIADDSPRFWQKNTPSHYPKWIPRARIPTTDGKPVDYAIVNNVETLAYLVNQGTITFHIYFSRIQTLDRPDFVLFDLDPGDAPLTNAIRIARQIHAFLNPLNIPAFVNTTGKRGLHILAPWHQPGGYDQARAWALRIAEQVVQAMPKIATLERRLAARAGRVYVDVMQNALGHHFASPYSIRPTPQATLSAPLQWRELTTRLDPARFNIRTIQNRVLRMKSDPMAPLLK
ncbi:MAG: non-homologous end-joining DNA ligase [Phycisphaerales bacterium]|nr:non-homologous end-joining DNA ligase [Phycisphaerales bacterium]